MDSIIFTNFRHPMHAKFHLVLQGLLQPQLCLKSQRICIHAYGAEHPGALWSAVPLGRYTRLPSCRIQYSAGEGLRNHRIIICHIWAIIAIVICQYRIGYHSKIISPIPSQRPLEYTYKSLARLPLCDRPSLFHLYFSYSLILLLSSLSTCHLQLNFT